MVAGGSDQIQVLRNGRLASAYPLIPVASSLDIWPHSLLLEVYRLPPMTTAHAIGIAHGLIVNLGSAAHVGWGFRTPDRLITFPPGGLCLGSPGEAIPAFRWSQPLSNAVVYLSPELFGHHAGPLRLSAEMASTDPLILKLVRLMKAELELGAPQGPGYGEALGHDLAVYLQQRYSAQPPGAAKGGLGPHRRNLVLEYMHAFIARPITLSELAALAGLTVFHFSRAFKRDFGVAPHQFLMNLRVEQAKYLLWTSSSDQAEIGRRLGFAGASHLGRIFRRATGLTPGAFRRLHRHRTISLR